MLSPRVGRDWLDYVWVEERTGVGSVWCSWKRLKELLITMFVPLLEY